MLVVLTSASYDVEILPSFVKYYSDLGVEAVHISVLELVPDLMNKTKEIAQSCSIPINVHQASERWRISKLEAQNKLELKYAAKLRPSDWYVPADLDEFINFKIPIQQIISEMDEFQYGYAMGTFIDRISQDGSLTTYDPKLSLWDQYPRKEHVTRDIMKSKCRKVVLARGHLAVSSGHHWIVDESYKMLPRDFVIDHFAWRAGRLEALQRRLENYSSLGISCDPLNRILEHLTTNCGKILVPSQPLI